MHKSHRLTNRKRGSQHEFRMRMKVFFLLLAIMSAVYLLSEFFRW